MTKDLNNIWGQCLQILRSNLRDNAYNDIFLHCRPGSLDEKSFTLIVPSEYFREEIENKYAAILVQVLRHVIGPSTNLSYSVEMVKKASENSELRLTIPSQSAGLQRERRRGGFNPFQPSTTPVTIESHINPEFTFDNFVEGDCNRFAFNQAKLFSDVSRNVSHFNPLFLWGGTGFGKTHLCHALGNAILQSHPDLRIIFVSAADFKQQFVDAANTDNISQFVSFYHSMDVLIVDDVHILGSSKKTQSQLHQIFNYLRDHGRRMVFSSNKQPSGLEDLNNELVSRFASGMTVELSPPDEETRYRILKQQTVYGGISCVPDDVLRFVAKKYGDSGDIRRLVGVATNLLARSVGATNADGSHLKVITLEFAERVLHQLVPIVEAKPLDIDRIIEVVAKQQGVEPSDIVGKSRSQIISSARQMVMYIARKYTKMTLADIGKSLGGKDHSTINHGVSKIQERMQVETVLQNDLQEVLKTLNIRR